MCPVLPLLDGIKVVEFSQLIAGPFCSLQLADLGADVVKVESAHGDYTRTWANLGEPSAIFEMLNRGKRGVRLDGRDPEDRAFARALAESADIVVESHGDAMRDTYGFTHDDIAAAGSAKVWCSISGMGAGRSGRAIDMTLQASMGITALTGEADGPPLRGAMPFVDFMTGMYAVQRILQARLRVERGQGGEWIDCAMVDATATLTAAPAALSLGGFSRPRRMGSETDLFVPSKVFACADGRHVHVVALSGAHWRAICSALERPDLADDPRFASNTDRLQHRGYLHAQLADELRRRPAAEWSASITQAGGFCVQVREIEEAWADPVMRERHLLADVDGVGFPVPVASLVGGQGATRRAPALGEHTEALRAGAAVR